MSDQYAVEARVNVPHTSVFTPALYAKCGVNDGSHAKISPSFGYIYVPKTIVGGRSITGLVLIGWVLSVEQKPCLFSRGGHLSSCVRPVTMCVSIDADAISHRVRKTYDRGWK